MFLQPCLRSQLSLNMNAVYSCTTGSLKQNLWNLRPITDYATEMTKILLCQFISLKKQSHVPTRVNPSSADTSFKTFSMMVTH